VTEYWKHQIVEGDRVDLIAHVYYNDAAKIELIFETNPELPFRNDLTGFVGKEIYIPVETPETIITKSDGLKTLIWRKK